jgi:hypothetical protein
MMDACGVFGTAIDHTVFRAREIPDMASDIASSGAEDSLGALFAPDTVLSVLLREACNSLDIRQDKVVRSVGGSC